MAVAIKFGDMTAVWNGRQWSGKEDSFVALLNACRHEAAGYLPDEVNARRMMARAVGDSGWSVIRSDPQPIEPGMIY